MKNNLKNGFILIEHEMNGGRS